MGKIRVKSFGDTEAEAKEAKLTQKRADAKLAKKAEQSAPVESETMSSPSEAAAPQEKKQKYAVATGNKKHLSPKYQDAVKLLEKGKNYKVTEALELLPKLTVAKFDETVELHINTTSTGIVGNMVLPHGTGKQTRVAIATEEIISEIEKGIINFDVLIAEPMIMAKLAKVARILGPKGLMPNPKYGTVTPKPEEAAKKFEGGQINFKTESKFPLLHLTVGKVSFGADKLQDNIKVALQSVQTKNIKTVTLKSTMSPGMKIDLASL
jgi:large subunit ribosomal protein L1